MKCNKSFRLTPRSIQERSSQHIHTLDICARLTGPHIRALSRQRQRSRPGLHSRRRILQLWTPMRIGRMRNPILTRRPLQALCPFFFRIVQFPSYGVQEADERGFADTPAEEGVCGERAKGVVADFGVGRGGAAVDEGEVGVGFEDRGVEEDEPDVDA